MRYARQLQARRATVMAKEGEKREHTGMECGER